MTGMTTVSSSSSPKTNSNSNSNSNNTNASSSSSGGIPTRFPFRLHKMLDEASQNGQDRDLISWLPCGTKFKIINPVEFSKTIMSKYCRHSKYKSFLRQLSMYKFQRIASGHSKGCYYHPHFVRNRLDLAEYINREMIQELPASVLNESGTTTTTTTTTRTTTSSRNREKAAVVLSTNKTSPASSSSSNLKHQMRGGRRGVFERAAARLHESELRKNLFPGITTTTAAGGSSVDGIIIPTMFGDDDHNNDELEQVVKELHPPPTTTRAAAGALLSFPPTPPPPRIMTHDDIVDEIIYTFRFASNELQQQATTVPLYSSNNHTAADLTTGSICI